ncbi:MAG: serine/threonine-protein phosphatase [Simkania sp.]|nr:serine/threonine-protein phosphatase [Simkania sp.]
MHIESFGLSDIGRKRQNNEDVFATLNELCFYALADGMGGHQAGEIAAQLAIESMCKTFLDDENLILPHPSHLLIEKLSYAIGQANRQVLAMAAKNKEWTGMGTTLSCLLLHNKTLFFGHVGDSRIYQCRNRLEQLTQDHTTHSQRKKGKITRAIGTSPRIEPEIGVIAPIHNDLYLLCSDGLTDHIEDEEIFRVIQEYKENTPLLCQKLVDAANAKGGTDNITVIAIKVVDN